MSNKEQLMTDAELAALPCGIDSFTDLRSNHMVYVDKTALIYKLAVRRGRLFISRPRRFGKTLLISTFESLFKNGLQDFKGLAIEKLWYDKTYPVIRINFALCKNFKTLSEFKSQMDEYVDKAFKKAGLILPFNKDDVLSRIKDYFDAHESDDVSPVLLIDEYDAPLNSCLNDLELFKDIRRELNKFYTLIKDISGRLRFFFFTGICKYKNLSIFSDTNYVNDISLDTKYGTLLGYTDDEVREYFAPFVENAAKVLDISVDECFAKLKESYDGYCFDRKALTHVHTPWSVLSFLNSPEDGFMNYWYLSGGKSSLLLNYIADHALQDPSQYGRDVKLSFSDLDSSRDVDHLSDYALLYQTGYLSIKQTDLDDEEVILNYPNAEVATSMGRLYAEHLFENNWPKERVGLSALKLFATVDLEKIPERLNRFLIGVDYNNYPIVSEAALETLLNIYACGGGIIARPEVHNAFGRSDVEFLAGKRYFVFELKLVHEGEDADKRLQEAIAQIKSRHYGEGYHEGSVLVRMALVFSPEQKMIVAHNIESIDLEL